MYPLLIASSFDARLESLLFMACGMSAVYGLWDVFLYEADGWTLTSHVKFLYLFFCGVYIFLYICAAFKIYFSIQLFSSIQICAASKLIN